VENLFVEKNWGKINQKKSRGIKPRDFLVFNLECDVLEEPSKFAVLEVPENLNQGEDGPTKNLNPSVYVREEPDGIRYHGEHQPGIHIEPNN